MECPYKFSSGANISRVPGCRVAVGFSVRFIKITLESEKKLFEMWVNKKWSGLI